MLALLSAKVKMFFVAARLSLILVWVVVIVVLFLVQITEIKD